MRRRITIQLMIGSVCVAVSACNRGDAQRQLTREADFIFHGTNVQPRSSTIDVDDASDFAIVRVDDIVAGSEVFRNLKGSQVTVRLKDPGVATVGEQRVYFTKGWHFGESIGLLEVGSVPAPTGRGATTMRSNIERFRQEQPDEELAERLRSAELVVSGKVIAVRKANLTRFLSEHDPDWHEADIEIDTVFRGKAPGRSITVLFPQSHDVMWQRSPKFEKGITGIWLLRPFDFAGKRLPHLIAPEPIDFRPRTEDARIKRLLQK